ncbi:hypothetical protein [Paucisalibacillus globulus]|uniref:hypothetical protein n=1 Tax=Paucisalibacillus globulus TaxID=351095 RepID=UPI00041916C2|nr:hypothetical protein [Paucisalibacillus globulus]
MGHDIYGINKNREEIAYARFSMGNPNATLLYRLLDAYEYFAGVSGTGEMASFSLQQMEEAWKIFKEYNKDVSFHSEDELENWDEKQIYKFIHNCLTTAQKEGSVRVYFG